MIMDGLVLVWSQLNQYIKQRTNDNEGDCVFLSSLAESSGSGASPADVITITLAHAEEEGVNRAQRFKSVGNGESHTYYEPEIRMNLYILISVRSRAARGARTTSTH